MGATPWRDAAPPRAAAPQDESVVKLDLIDFFGSTRADRIERYFRFVGWTEEAAGLLTRLTTYEGALPQGAPTSPALSNRVNYGLDAIIAGRYRVNYTRYADDITISFRSDSPRIARGVVQHVRRAAKRFGYRVHTGKKLRVLRRHQSQRVTGLVVNDGVRVPRETRRWLRAVEHRLATGKQATLTRAELEGWKAYVAFVDRTRPGAARLRKRLQEALVASHHSLTYGAEHFGCSKRVFVALLKHHGLWDPRPNRRVPERGWN
ncbi:MAG: reverse transcriptase family protein [Nannocystaceae bacterium]|nr:reverse transcriptase family protein [bacterium]